MKARNYKIGRYSKLQDLCVEKKVRVTKLCVKVSFLGVFPNNIEEFRNFWKQYNCINVVIMMEKLSEVAIRSSYFNCTRRNKKWEYPEILKFYW